MFLKLLAEFHCGFGSNYSSRSVDSRFYFVDQVILFLNSLGCSWSCQLSISLFSDLRPVIIVIESGIFSENYFSNDNLFESNLFQSISVRRRSFFTLDQENVNPVIQVSVVLEMNGLQHFIVKFFFYWINSLQRRGIPK